MAVEQSPMNQLITEHIDIWTSAVKTKSTSGRGSSKKLELYGVKKLRELILELAVRGKLVPQDPNDEPAAVLLERIALEKAQLVKEKKIKKPKQLPNISDEEKPFDLPNGWRWVRFPDVAYYGAGKTPATKNSLYWDETGSGIPWVSIADLNDKSTVSVSTKKISDVAVEQVFKRTPIPAGTMLMSFKLTVGKTSILNVDAFHNEAIISVFPYTGVLQSYLFKVLPSRANSGNKKNAIMGLTLNAESLSLLTIPLPPEAEQHRIVAKVDELMAICDQLEQQTEASIEAHQVLVITLLDTLTNSADADELMQNWARISEHFDTLFTTEESIDQLKQTILQLAVMGKLVPQDPNDEPASELLKRIAGEKALLPITENETPLELPKGWSNFRIVNMLNTERGGMVTGPFGSALKKSEHQSFGVPVWGIESIKNGRFTYKNNIFVSEEKSKELLSFSAVAGDIIISRSGTIDEVGVIPIGVENGLISTNLIRVSLTLELIEPEYFCFLFKGSPQVFNKIKELCAGTTRLFLNQKILKSLDFPIPPIKEQRRIVSKVKQLFEMCEQVTFSIQDNQTTQLLLTDAIVELAV